MLQSFDELIDLMASEDKICKYVDLPLQHAHNDVLKRMRRSDTKESVEELLKKLRERIPGVVIGSTFYSSVSLVKLIHNIQHFVIF